MMSMRLGIVVPVVLAACQLPVAQAGGPGSEAGHSCLPAVQAFADNVLRYGRDVYGAKPTPLFADGLNVETHEPAVWKLESQYVEKWKMPREWVLSNLASQQNLFRVLVALTQITGDAKYKQAAVDATRYALDHLRHESGLLFWGGHAAWDLRTNQPVGEGRAVSGGVAGKHELKCNLPYYELMWEIDPDATRKFIESFWSNHILRWDILDMNRHGYYKPVPPGPWDHDYVGGPVPFAGEGLTFINTGSDLWYAAALLYQFSGNKQALTWAKRMAGRYAEARDPRTGLGADNYSTLKPDRMTQQFGAEFGNRFTEATVTSLYGIRYHRAAICGMKLFERLGTAGEEFKRWAIEDLAAYAKHAYDPADNTFWPTLIDGTRLTPADRKRAGYVEKRWLEKRPATGLHLWAYGLAYKLSGDELMWRMTRSIARGLDLGDLGEKPGTAMALNLNTHHAEPETIFALLELHKATRQDEFLRLAQHVGDNLMNEQFRGGFFVPAKDSLMSKFDTITPLALLHLEAAVRKLPVRVPEYESGRSYFHCSFEGRGRTYDNDAIYGIPRSSLKSLKSLKTTSAPATKR
jgi:pectate lyase